MEHTQIVSANELESFADTRISESVIPELVWSLIKQTEGLTAIRMPYGDAVNQVGLDGSVETQTGFPQYVPAGKSYWEIGTGGTPQTKATGDFRKRTRQVNAAERANCTFIFVTPRSGGAGGWPEPKQRRWLQKRRSQGWRDIIIIDGVRLADWLREFPAIGKWLAKKMELTKSIAGFWTPSEHWELLQQCQLKDDPVLLPKVFLAGRDLACSQLAQLFQGNMPQLAIAGESESDTMDFVAAFLASLEPKISQSYSSKCLFFDQDEAWLSMSGLKQSHVLVAHPAMDLESRGERLYSLAKKNKHSVIYQTSNSAPGGGENLVRISSPSAALLESVLLECGYSPSRAKEAASAGAASLDALKRHLRGQSGPPQYAAGSNARALALAEMLCRWNGQNPADREIIEEFLRGKSYGEWIETIQNEALRPGAPLSQRDDVWKFISRLQAWSALGAQLVNDDLDAFQKIALKVLGESDPKLDLAPEARYAANIHGKVLKYSPYLRQGIADTMALLGSRPKWLTQCTVNKPELVAALIVRELLYRADWTRWASLNNLLPLLAEASPESFLESVEYALKDVTQSPFGMLFAQERAGLTGGNYMTGLLWALESLAWDKEYLARVTVVLGELSEIDPGGNWTNRPSNSLGTIFMPWLPQTCAPINVRYAAIRTLAKEHPKIAWKLLLRLLPRDHGFSTGSHKPVWREFILPTHTEKQTGAEYLEQILGYADMAVKAASNDIEKLAELIERLPNLPRDTPVKVLDHLISDEVIRLPAPQRVKLWEALVDLALKHRKFADANWSMKLEMVQKIEETAAKLAPESPTLLYRRLFSERDFDLMEEKGSYEEQVKNLNRRRQIAIGEILTGSGIEGVVEFAQQVASPWQVGFALGEEGSQEIDTFVLPRFLTYKERAMDQFSGGYIWGRYFSLGWNWVDGLKLDLWNVNEKTIFLACLPFQKETWERVDNLLGQNQEAYWARINPNPYSAGEHVMEAVERLLEHGRPRLAIQGLNALVHTKKPFPVELAIRCLNANLSSKDAEFDQHDIMAVIKWLQDLPDADADLLSKIEWAYLPLLDRLYGNSPKTLEKKLAKDPAFFCQVIQAVFKSKKEKEDKPVTDEQKKIAENAFRLLQQWQIVPGDAADGAFNADAFNEWLGAVKSICNESGHLAVALSQVGEVLPYAPADGSGLWIHKAVAEALNAKDADKMRSGFTCELFNMRGVHGFSAGADELKLAEGYRQKAETVEAEGYHRLAASLKSLAASYEAEANREKASNPYED